eukprot:g10809.t1
MVLSKKGAKATSANGAAAGGKRTSPRSAVEDVLAALSLESSGGSAGDPSKHLRQRNKMHEVEMDENNVVVHTRRGSTAVGVTPSDPSAIVDLFQEVESIGSTYFPEDDSDSTTDEAGDSSHHPPTAAAGAVLPAAQTSAAAPSAAPEAGERQSSAESGSTLGSTTHEHHQQQHHHHKQEHQPAASSGGRDDGAAGSAGSASSSVAKAAAQQQPKKVGRVAKVWGQMPQQQQQLQGQEQQKPAGKEPASSTRPTETTFTPAALPGPAVGGGDAAPRPYWPSNAATATATAAPALASAGPGEDEGAVGDGQEGAREEKEETEQKHVSPTVPEPPPKPGLLPSRGSYSSLQLNSVSESQQAPLRRKTSMGSFQKGMGESLTGRLRKQLDIPDAPKREIDTNIPIDQIQSLKYLAQGAMCVAYTALLNGQTVVLKTPLPDTSHAAVAANDLEVEMLLLKELHHDNIVSLLGAGFLPDGRRFVALEYLSGGTLSEVLRDHSAKPLGISKVLDLSLALCNALEYLHDVAVPGRIVCHRDLKPDNIGFAEDGTLKLIDFGLGKIIKRKFRVRAEKYHMTGGTGSLRYMAPEIADHQEYNEKGDVYSFSLIMWEMLAGTKPFLGLKRPDFYNRVVDQGERPPLDPEWPQPIRNLLESCWRTNLDERLSFREVAGILKVCAEEENQRSFTEEKRKSIRVSTRRSRLWTTTGARPDLDEISVDPQYKPKFKISSFLSNHNSTGGVKSTMEKLRSVAKGGSKANRDGSIRRSSSDNTGKNLPNARRTTTDHA